jgi:pyrroline-5-carboxylate reductase
MPSTLSFIGGGNMARSLIGGLIARGTDAQRITVTDPVAAQLESLRRQFAVHVSASNDAAVRDAEVVLLAIKPQEMHQVTAQLSPTLAAKRPLIISVAAGIRASDIQRWCNGLPVVRCMPNRPALQGCGMTGLYATDNVSEEQRTVAFELMSAVGSAVWLEQEAQLDAVTAISGSGPAYFFLLIEMLEQTGVALGLSAEVSHQLAVETAYGAGCMAREATEPAAVLREQVTSKGGTTAAALQTLEARNVRAIFAEAITAAARRSAQLAQEFGAG